MTRLLPRSQSSGSGHPPSGSSSRRLTAARRLMITSVSRLPGSTWVMSSWHRPHGAAHTTGRRHHAAPRRSGAHLRDHRRDRGVAAARRLARELGACRYVVAEVPGEPLRSQCADLVYIGKGALIWMAELPAWAAADAGRLRHPAGHLFVYEAHSLAPPRRPSRRRVTVRPTSWSSRCWPKTPTGNAAGGWR